MRFDELNESNYIMFAIKNYENPQAVTQEDFYEDMKRFKWVKRLLNKYKNTGDLNVHLVMNHFIILYNVFGDATTPLLFYKLDKDLWNILKTFVIYCSTTCLCCIASFIVFSRSSLVFLASNS